MQKLNCALFCLAVALSTAVLQAQVPTKSDFGTVVFFTPGGHWRGMGEKTNPFAMKAKTMSSGSVFDRDAKVATLTHSRYLALRLPVGDHTFSASYHGGSANPKEAVQVTLKPGEVLYFEITTTVPSLVAGYHALEKSHVTASSCQQFKDLLQEDSYDPVPDKEIETPYRSAVDSTTDLSTCNH